MNCMHTPPYLSLGLSEDTTGHRQRSSTTNTGFEKRSNATYTNMALGIANCVSVITA